MKGDYWKRWPTASLVKDEWGNMVPWIECDRADKALAEQAEELHEARWHAWNNYEAALVIKWRDKCGATMAHAVSAAVRNGWLDARCAAADAALDYLNVGFPGGPHTAVTPECLAIEKLEGARVEAERQRDEARKAVAFFASVIKCGEPWTAQCEQAMKAAMDDPATPAQASEPTSTPQPYGTCTLCGKEVYPRRGKPGEYDHDCDAARASEPDDDERKAQQDRVWAWMWGEHPADAQASEPAPEEPAGEPDRLTQLAHEAAALQCQIDAELARREASRAPEEPAEGEEQGNVCKRCKHNFEAHMLLECDLEGCDCPAFEPAQASEGEEHG